MNQSQLFSFIRSVFKISGAALAAHGANKSTELLNKEDLAGVALILIGTLWSHFRHRETSPPSPRFVPRLFLLPLIAIAIGGCGTLDKAGVYQGDQTLYTAELVIVTSKDVVQTFVTWELQNRAALARTPEVTKAADFLRRNFPKWKKSADALHDAYKLDPSTPNKTALENALAVLRTALTEAAGYMSRAAMSPPTP